MVTIKEHNTLFFDFPEESRTWIFQSVVALTTHQILQTKDMMRQFVQTWDSHSVAVQSDYALVGSHFLVVVADEQYVKVGGCSGDSLHRFIRDCGEIVGVNWLDRLSIAVVQNDKYLFFPKKQLIAWAQDQPDLSDVFLINGNIATLKEFKSSFCIPILESWIGSALDVQKV